jgi:hypothetical protein
MTTASQVFVSGGAADKVERHLLSVANILSPNFLHPLATPATDANGKRPARVVH